jgi:hypothetical protein
VIYRGGSDLSAQLPRGFTGDDLPRRIGQALKHAESEVDWRATWDDAIEQRFGHSRADLSPAESKQAWTMLAHVADAVTRDGKDFPPLTDRQIANAFAYAFGVAVEVKRRAE